MTHPVTPVLPPATLADALHRLLRGESRTPHDVLGAHPARVDEQDGALIRARLPGVTAAWALVGDETLEMALTEQGLFTRFIEGMQPPFTYRLRVLLADGSTRDIDDPYRFLPTLGPVDLHLFGEGRHLRLWEKLGSHRMVVDGVDGVSFAVWAPNATRVSVIGSFNGWDGRAHVMRALGGGVFELFVPGVRDGALYKYEIRAPQGVLRIKTDPYAQRMQGPPGHASVVTDASTYAWNDSTWLARRAETDPARAPMLIYEVHLASWMRGGNNEMLSYRELAPLLAAHVKRLGFTHVELLPVQEHPYGGSWGYQVGGYYAPTGQHGSPDDFRFLVDTLHQAGIGVLLDWVPAHFPKDDWALRRFDGTACYEHEDPRLGDHPEWGTHIFNYARHEVRNFLLANALYWIEAFHIDGIRVDAVASMLYLDYGRENGQWLRNRFGGRENLEAVSFLKQLNHTVHRLHPGVITMAEESTTYPRVTHGIADGGLGFTFKWNMGWMHDTLDYFRVDPFFRRGAHDKLTFGMMYEYSERFVNPLSHDEVVHLKKSLLEKMPGDAWQKFANLRALLAYTITRPGKALLFMGTELAPSREWNHDASLDWALAEDPRRRGVGDLIAALGALYASEPAFWRRDHESSGYSWIGVSDKEQSVISYARFDGVRHAVIVLNLTPVPRPQYRIGAPAAGTYRLALNTDDEQYGGSAFPTPATVATEHEAYHGFPQSMVLTIPPLSAMVFLPETLPEIAEKLPAHHEVVDAVVDAVVASDVDAEVDAPGGDGFMAPDAPLSCSLTSRPASIDDEVLYDVAALLDGKRKKPKKAKSKKAPDKTAKADKQEAKRSKASKPGKADKGAKAEKTAKAEKPSKADKSGKARKSAKGPEAANVGEVKDESPTTTKRPRTRRPPPVPPGHPPAPPILRPPRRRRTDRPDAGPGGDRVGDSSAGDSSTDAP